MKADDLNAAHAQAEQERGAGHDNGAAEPTAGESTTAKDRLQEQIRWLAARLPPDIDRRREGEEERLGVRVSTPDDEVLDDEVLDDEVSGLRSGGGGRPLALAAPEPWPEPVDGAALLDALTAALTRYVALPGDAATATALLAVHTHALNAAQHAPRLGIVSPEKRCGKTRLLEALYHVVPRALPASNVTPSTVFRTVAAAQPTLLIDEADTFLKGNQELRGIINSGHIRATAFVVRIVAGEPRRFPTWTAMAIAAIGTLPETITDRSVIIAMRRRAPGEKVARLRADRCGDLVEVGRQAARWVTDHINELREADPVEPEELEDRAADNWRPLLAIADLAGGEWPERARRAAVALSGGDAAEDPSAGVRLLADLRDLFDTTPGGKIWSAEACAALAATENRPWPEWKGGKPITPWQLAKLLEPFGIKPRQVWKGGENRQGYEREQFNDAFTRYPPRNPRPLDSSVSSASSGFQHPRPSPSLGDENGPKPSVSAESRGLGDQNPPSEGEG